ncbi:hypothetical protein GQ53DRAFT_751588 [Thozetella sp. PMI_491]|nr:hypothetical protein GQ53DRAFT_751588 [Thozetella sp. PMI_491]
MTGVLNTTHTIELKGALPAGCTPEKAIALLHDHEYMIRLDKNLDRYETNEAPKKEPEAVDAALKPCGETKLYLIHDNVKNVPGGIWDSKVDSSAEYTNLESGIFILSRPPMGIVSRGKWLVQGGELVVVTEISCSKLLLPVVKSGYKENLDGMFDAILKKLAA